MQTLLDLNQRQLNRRLYRSKATLDERLVALKHVAIAYPSGNVTAVVFDKLFNVDLKALNQNIMSVWKTLKPNEPEIEQCCFVTKAENPEALARVEMFGGEFCGNATRSAVWLITQGHDYEGFIEVSGVSRPLKFIVKNRDVTVEMPLPEKGKLIEAADEGILVHLDGITHLVVKADPRRMLEDLLKKNKYGFRSMPAVGVSSFDEATGKSMFCVWVKAVDTIFDESACGSGTCSIGIALANKNKKSIEMDVIQPSGKSIRTRAEYDSQKGVIQSFIAGKVDVLHDGEFKPS